MGGVLTDITGQPYKYNKDVVHMDAMGVLATPNQQLHDDIVKDMPVEAVNSLKAKAKKWTRTPLNIKSDIKESVQI